MNYRLTKLVVLLNKFYVMVFRKIYQLYIMNIVINIFLIKKNIYSFIQLIQINDLK